MEMIKYRGELWLVSCLSFICTYKLKINFNNKKIANKKTVLYFQVYAVFAFEILKVLKI